MTADAPRDDDHELETASLSSYVRNLHGIRANHNEPVPRWIAEEIRLKNTTTRMHAESWFTNSTMWDCG